MKGGVSDEGGVIEKGGVISKRVALAMAELEIRLLGGVGGGAVGLKGQCGDLPLATNGVCNCDNQFLIQL